MDTSKVNRIEIIDLTKGVDDEDGRTLVIYRRGLRVWLELHHNDHTLKVFVAEDK